MSFRITLQSSLLLFSSLVVSVGLAELVVRIAAPQDLSGSWRVATDSGLKVNKSSGQAIHQLGDRRAVYRFHPPHLRDTELKPESTRILVLGDSFTFGWFLNAEDTYVYHLQEFANRELGQDSFNFLNAAAGGWGTAHYVAFVEEIGGQISPDIILVFLNVDDIGRSIKSGLFDLVDMETLVLRRNRVPKSLLKHMVNSIPGYQYALERSHLLQIIRRFVLLRSWTRWQESPRLEGSRDPGLPDDPIAPPLRGNLENRALGQALFLRLKSWCDQNDAELLVTTTGWPKVSYGDWPTDPTEFFMLTASEFFDNHGIKFRDISPEVQLALESSSEAFFLTNYDGHPNESGSRLIARHAWAFLSEELRNYSERKRASVVTP